MLIWVFGLCEDSRRRRGCVLLFFRPPGSKTLRVFKQLHVQMICQVFMTNISIHSRSVPILFQLIIRKSAKIVTKSDKNLNSWCCDVELEPAIKISLCFVSIFLTSLYWLCCHYNLLVFSFLAILAINVTEWEEDVQMYQKQVYNWGWSKPFEWSRNHITNSEESVNQESSMHQVATVLL